MGGTETLGHLIQAGWLPGSGIPGKQVLHYRGFHIHKSHISDPQRLSRLLRAACLAYLWIVY